MNTVRQPKVRRCGHCKGSHDTVAQARMCAHRHYVDRAEQDEANAQAQAEYLAEQRYERWLEDGGAARERIAWEHEQDRLREM